jgi:hypothetical protein
MPHMILNRNLTYISLEGNSVAFAKGEPSYIPKSLVSWALGIGAEFADEDDEQKFSPKHDENAPLFIEPTGEDREEAIMAAMELMQERNSREDFTAAGLPNTTTLRKIVGFNVDMRERNGLWQRFLDKKKAEAEQ